MTPAERTAKIAELRAEADRLEREGKRNWPDRIKPGMLFRHIDGTVYLAHNLSGSGVELVGIFRIGTTTTSGTINWLESSSEDFKFLGVADDLLTIKMPDAPEPTGAELVGKVCDFSDNGVYREDRP